MVPRVLMVVGSLRTRSLNRQLAHEAARLLEGRAEVAFLDYRDVPFMNQDLESPVPAPVARVRAEVLAADGLWVFTPEYNYSYPGVLKNLLDWLSRPADPADRHSASVAADKAVTVSGAAGRSAAAGSRARLQELLRTIGMRVMVEPQVGVALDGTAFASDELALAPGDRAALAAQADAFLGFLRDGGEG